MGNKRFRETRLAVVWGALWGAASGFWFLAPYILRSHHMLPFTLQDWLVLDLALLLAFSAIGAACAILAAFPLVAWKAAWGRDFKQPSWAFGIGVGALLVPAYAGLTVLIPLSLFHSLSGIDIQQILSARVGTPYVVVLISSLLVYRWLVALRAIPPPAMLEVILLSTAFLGAGTLPYRVEEPSLPKDINAPSLIRLASRRQETTPLLFVGIDAAHWRVLRPLLDQGKLPTFAHLISGGIRGTVTAPWPPYWSAPAWAAITTGYSREETGVHEDLAVEAPGFPTYQLPLTKNLFLGPFLLPQYALDRLGILRISPPPRSMLKRAPFWELIASAGIKTAVVRFPFTFPAKGQAHVVISDQAGSDSWSLARVRTEAVSGLASSTAHTDRLAGVFSGAPRINPSDVVVFVSNPTHPQPRDSVVDPVRMFRIALEIDRRTFDASEYILRTHPDLRVLAVYLGGFDTICHSFWRYRFPQDFPADPPAAADIDQLGRVIDRYLEFLDRELKNLITGFPVRPTVIVVSDHGYGATGVTPLWRGWHSPEGIFIAGGPGVPHRSTELNVSYYDVVPTVMELLGFAKPEGMRGGSLLNR